MEIQFYTISEDMARAANDANSMSDYKQGSATEEYRKRVESVYAVVEKIKQKRRTLLKRQREWQGDTAKSWRNTTIPTTETKRAVRQF